MGICFPKLCPKDIYWLSLNTYKKKQQHLYRGGNRCTLTLRTSSLHTCYRFEHTRTNTSSICIYMHIEIQWNTETLPKGAPLIRMIGQGLDLWLMTHDFWQGWWWWWWWWWWFNVQSLPKAAKHPQSHHVVLLHRLDVHRNRTAEVQTQRSCQEPHLLWRGTKGKQRQGFTTRHLGIPCGWIYPGPWKNAQ